MGKLTDLLAEPPPPAYEKVAKYRTHGTLPGGLDAALWLNILSRVVQGGVRRSKEEQAVGRAELHRNVRFACKDLYLVCMHVLRSHYVERYVSRIRAPYTSEPYPRGQMLPFAPSSAASGSRTRLSYAPPPVWDAPQRSGNGAGRETRVFDLFIAACVREDVEAFESSLLDSSLGEYEQGETDLFTVHQPQSRLEDLLITQGRRYGLVLADAEEDLLGDAKGAGNLSSSSGKQKSATIKPHRNALAAEDLAVEMRGRSVVLRVRNHQSSSKALRTYVEVPRTKVETLETLCVRLMTAIRDRP